MNSFLLQLKVPFFHSPRSHSQDTLERFWFNSTAWHRDVTAWRYQTCFPISACRCARKMILFLFLWYFVLLSSQMLSVLYLHDDVTALRHAVTSKTDCTLSQLVEVLKRWFFFVLIVFRLEKASLSLKMLSFLCSHDVTTSWRDVMMSQSSFLLSQLVDVLKQWYTCISVDISVDGFQAIIVYVFVWCHHVIPWRHDVTKITTWRQETNCRSNIIIGPNIIVFEKWVRTVDLPLFWYFLAGIVTSWYHDVHDFFFKLVTYMFLICLCVFQRLRNNARFLMVTFRLLKIDLVILWHFVCKFVCK